MLLSKDFKLEEFTRSKKAKEKKIDNSLDPDNPAHQKIIQNLQALVDNVLQPLRDRAGRLVVTSGYRCQALNEALDGSDTSQHMTGQAADIKPGEPDVTRADLVNFALQDKLPFHQIICYTYKSHLHVSHDPGRSPEIKISTAPKQYGKLGPEDIKRLCKDHKD
jgi:hypothetical protein